MSGTFAYARVSTVGQEPGNQIMEIEAAGFSVGQHRVVSETRSGSTAVAQRKGFSRLLDRMEKGDVRVVTKPDRLGCDAIDVSAAAADLEEMGIRVHCLAPGGVDLTSSAGKMTMNVINAVASSSAIFSWDAPGPASQEPRRPKGFWAGPRPCPPISRIW